MQKIEDLLDEMIKLQQETTYKCAKRIVPHLTPEDMLQPNDYPELELNPHFRYEEGVLSGLLSVRFALKI